MLQIKDRVKRHHNKKGTEKRTKAYINEERENEPSYFSNMKLDVKEGMEDGWTSAVRRQTSRKKSVDINFQKYSKFYQAYLDSYRH